MKSEVSETIKSVRKFERKESKYIAMSKNGDGKLIRIDRFMELVNTSRFILMNILSALQVD